MSRRKIGQPPQKMLERGMDVDIIADIAELTEE